MDAACEPAAWHDFGVALAGASAPLLGLIIIIVVVSLHLKAVVSDSVLRRPASIRLRIDLCAHVY